MSSRACIFIRRDKNNIPHYEHFYSVGIFGIYILAFNVIYVNKKTDEQCSSLRFVFILNVFVGADDLGSPQSQMKIELGRETLPLRV